MQDGRPFRKVPNPPTARELLKGSYGDLIVLAARVGKVLTLIQAQRSYVGVARAMLDASQVERILNGESE